jgi:hypothetical protein
MGLLCENQFRVFCLPFWILPSCNPVQMITGSNDPHFPNSVNNENSINSIDLLYLFSGVFLGSLSFSWFRELFQCWILENLSLWPDHHPNTCKPCVRRSIFHSPSSKTQKKQTITFFHIIFVFINNKYFLFWNPCLCLSRHHAPMITTRSDMHSKTANVPITSTYEGISIRESEVHL